MRREPTEAVRAALHVKPGTEWTAVLGRASRTAPEAFGADRLHNLVDGSWRAIGEPDVLISPVDGSKLIGLPRVSAGEARHAVHAAAAAHREWARTALADRKARVSAAVDAMAGNRDDLALLLAWEIGKPWRLACADVDRALDGVRWYVEEIEAMLGDRTPLPGPVSNIASWNYPMSVQVHAELVQLLAGNAVVAKTPSQGGAACLTLAHALMADAGLPVTLVSGGGAQLSEVLVRSPEVGAMAFVGGRTAGRKVTASLLDSGKRHMLEQEGLNAWGIWEFSDWDGLATHLKKGFEYAKQRCTAYPRYVVQRELVDQFLAMYLPVLASIRFGHPLAVEADDDALPELDFGPVISAGKAEELAALVSDALDRGAVPLYRGSVSGGRFIEGQDTSAYVAPTALLEPGGASPLRHAEPFGPVDTIVVVDSEADLLAQMNASNGALVASLACDDEAKADRLAHELQAYKVGINKPRSRGDRAETFGGRGASWLGCFVGGELLVQAVTQGQEDELLYGNFPTHARYPATI
jgi:acyl-CoA reductase-like NAD-dependent aldehyde dehydrogenase